MSDRANSTLAIDFGTSNSAAAVLDGGVVRRVPLEAGADTLPTAVFFPTGGPMQIGTAAGEALIAGTEGRYMRALKSVLGTSLFHESRLIGGKRRTLAGIVTDFLREVKERAEHMTGRNFTSVVSGRPVHFHSDDAARDARAAEDLAACYRAAGFERLRFVYEPEAAALAAGRGEGPGLVVDIGGGTSDFSVFRDGPKGAEILSSHGIRLGGTDFDQSISLTHVMPLLGHGSQLTREMGGGLLPMPKALYVDLATWARIPFLYGPDTRRTIRDYAKHAVEPNLITRLQTVIEEELGHDIAFAVERGKIAANGRAGEGRVALGLVEPGLHAGISRLSMDAALAAQTETLTRAIRDTLTQATVAPGDVSRVVLVGGSSLMSLVEAAARETCPTATLERSEAFTAVVDGLALAIDRRIGVPV
ncbi:Hsp70 family protein [Maritimibacter sp. UBA3975]|uniref:Hsp70 family protein n=1 Tax=Maritimibacter sp. UBA3975 TaxID=1946833 RepID=UPI000C0AFA03|nr:Hsp70 family protein [Maritimibacter sp. UBA3975]MAM60507.1 hsp70 family protein [Maritimibacter sp.]